MESIQGFGTATALLVPIGTSTEEKRQGEEKAKEGKEAVKAVGVGSREIEVHLPSDMVIDGQGKEATFEAELTSVLITDSTLVPISSALNVTAADRKSRADCVDAISTDGLPSNNAEGKSECEREGYRMQTSIRIADPLLATIGTRHSLSSASDTASPVTPINRGSSADGVDGDNQEAVSGGEGQGQGEKEKEEDRESERQPTSNSEPIPSAAIVTPSLSVSASLLDLNSNLSAVGHTGLWVATVGLLTADFEWK